MASPIYYFAMVGNIIKYGWPFFFFAMLIIAKIKWKNWPIDAVIIEKRGETNFIKTNDRAGRYVDKFTGLIGYKLLKSKDTIPAVDYNWVLHNTPKNTNILEKLVNLLRPTQGTLFLYKYGSKQYKPINIKHNPEAKLQWQTIKDDDGKDVYVTRYQQYDPRGILSAVDFEVVDWDNMNFIVQEMRSAFERRRKKNEWVKTLLVPITIISVVALVSIVMMKFSLDWSKTVPSTRAPTPADPTPNVPIIGDAFTPGK